MRYCKFRSMIDQINQITDFIEQYKYLAAIIYIFLSFIIAFIVDKVIISLLKKIVKTRFSIVGNYF